MLAVQASHATPPRPTDDKARPSSSPGAERSTKPRQPAPVAIPADSGQGRRMVYSLGQQRVWLVDANNGAQRSFTVWPGTLSPAKGSYAVSFRRDKGIGSDGVEIENIVYFATKSGVSIGFSQAVDGSSPKPAPGAQTGGIRLRPADGDAVWTFGTAGTTVTVVD
ncbi:hypothetical protein [Streptomyces sp. NPDC000410]|uniref:hypothetical protein n=1 Tax=Streptomyces sp. NPDC000410 TaxID=3154254 RepID=UPI003324F5CB